MSGYIARDAKTGTGTYVVIGAVALGLFALLFAGVNKAASMLFIRAPGAVVQMPGGSTPANLATLQHAFGPLVVDLGGGRYQVTVAADQMQQVTAGAKVL